MMCIECKENPATLHFTQIINGKKTEVRVCERCAQKEGYVTSTDETFSLHELLTGLFNASSQSNQVGIQNERFFDHFTELKCEKCQLSFSQFQRIGKFGCANCYEAFKPRLNTVIRRVHSGNTAHKGKIPKRKGGRLHLEKEIAMYREYLQQLIAEENFEEAAIIRDRIKELEQSEGGDKS